MDGAPKRHSVDNFGCCNVPLPGVRRIERRMFHAERSEDILFAEIADVLSSNGLDNPYKSDIAQAAIAEFPAGFAEGFQWTYFLDNLIRTGTAELLGNRK